MGGDGDQTRTSAGTRQSVHWGRARSVRPTAGRLSARSFVILRTGILACPGCAARQQRTDRQEYFSYSIPFGLRFRPDGYGQRKQIDEALGVPGVVATHGKAGKVR